MLIPFPFLNIFSFSLFHYLYIYIYIYMPSQQSLMEIGLDLQFALSPFFQEKFRRLTGKQKVSIYQEGEREELFSKYGKDGKSKWLIDSLASAEVVEKIYEEKGVKKSHFLRYLVQLVWKANKEKKVGGGVGGRVAGKGKGKGGRKVSRNRQTVGESWADISNWWKFGLVALKHYHNNARYVYVSL